MSVIVGPWPDRPLPRPSLRLVEPLSSRQMRRVGPLGGIFIACALSLVLWAGLFGAFSFVTQDSGGPSAATFTPVTVPYVAPAEAFKPPSPIEVKAPTWLLPQTCPVEGCPAVFIPRV